MRVGKRSFFNRSTHAPLPLLGLSRHNPTVGTLVVSCFKASSGLAPGRHRVTAAGSFSFTAAVWMIDRVHSHATVMRRLAQPASPPRFAERDILVIEIANLPDCGHALDRNTPDFARRQFQQRQAAFLRNQLRL